VAGQGANLEAGGPHAEVVAINAAGPLAGGATLYATLEPCCHVGRTGPCVERIVAAGVRRVVIAAADPNPIAGGGAHYLRSKGLDVTEGVCEPDAVRQNAPFRTWIARRRPFAIAKAAVTADGFVGRTGSRLRISGPAADRWFHRLRAEIDAILVGAATVLADDPLLTAREVFRYRPLIRVVTDWRLRVLPGARLFSTLEAGPVIMMVLEREAAARPSHVDALERLGVQVERRDSIALEGVFAWLAEQQVLSVLVEGGPVLQEACARDGLVDRVQVSIGGRRLDGADGVPASPFITRLLAAETRPEGRRLGDDLLIEWDVHGTDRVGRNDRAR
jgi:diaminohydroxyphosphoribosylaminopyrimidine deaminase/5-amino-6-(5-phosphoribosylamino)uracil reductase